MFIIPSTRYNGTYNSPQLSHRQTLMIDFMLKIPHPNKQSSTIVIETFLSTSFFNSLHIIFLCLPLYSVLTAKYHNHKKYVVNKNGRKKEITFIIFLQLNVNSSLFIIFVHCYAAWKQKYA